MIALDLTGVLLIIDPGDDMLASDSGGSISSNSSSASYRNTRVFMLSDSRLRGDAYAVEIDDAGDEVFEVRVTIATGFLGEVRALDLSTRGLMLMLSGLSPRIGRLEAGRAAALAYGCRDEDAIGIRDAGWRP